MQLVKAVRWLLLALVGFGVQLLPATAFAAFGLVDDPHGDWKYSVAFAVLDHDTELDWASRTVEGGTDYNAEVLFNRSLYDRVPFGVIRPTIGITVNDQGDSSRIYAGALWQLRFESRLLFNIGMGLALHDGTVTSSNRSEKQFGTRVVFRLPIEVGYAFNARSRLLLVLEHMSNGSLADPNHGMDALGIRYRYRFH